MAPKIDVEAHAVTHRFVLSLRRLTNLLNVSIGLLLTLVPAVPDLLVNVVLVGANAGNLLMFLGTLVGGPIRACVLHQRFIAAAVSAQQAASAAGTSSPRVGSPDSVTATAPLNAPLSPVSDGVMDLDTDVNVAVLSPGGGGASANAAFALDVGADREEALPGVVP